MRSSVTGKNLRQDHTDDSDKIISKKDDNRFGAWKWRVNKWITSQSDNIISKNEKGGEILSKFNINHFPSLVGWYKLLHQLSTKMITKENEI